MNRPEWFSDDDALMDELAQALGTVDDERLTEDARACFTWRNLDQDLELLTLSYDSSLTRAAFRGEPGQAARMLVYENDDVTVEIQVGAHTLMGQIVPAVSSSIVLEHARDGATETQADDAGYFLFRRPASGAVRLRVLGDPGLVTEWLPI
jgi:hypothetical protein